MYIVIIKRGVAVQLDYLIVGNGVIGTLCALELARRHPKRKIAIVGPQGRDYSASAAAGAMHAVYCEMERGPNESRFESLVYHEGLKARVEWRALLKSMSNGREVISAKSTILFLKKGANEFEEKNFRICEEIARQDRKARLLGRRHLSKYFATEPRKNIACAIEVTGEFAFNTPQLFKTLDAALVSAGVKMLVGVVRSLESSRQGIRASFIDGGAKNVSASRVVLAAGSECNEVIRDFGEMLPIFRGVGAAFEVTLPDASSLSLPDSVIRSVNRGGAQCGIHYVPRGKRSAYVGAGNYVSASERDFRLDTLRYLVDTARSDILGSEIVYQLRTSPVLGLRPRSLDGMPLVGPLTRQPKIFVATGTNRIGLTLATRIARQCLLWSESKPVEPSFKGLEPDRRPISYGSLEHALDYFVESRLANLAEHGMLPTSVRDLARKRAELVGFGIQSNSRIKRKLRLSGDFCVDPDLWSVL